MSSGYDRYLEYQYQQSGGFFTSLFQVIGRADPQNAAKLSKGFPEEVDALIIWRDGDGAAGLAKMVTPTHPLLFRLQEEYNLEIDDGS